MGAPSWGKGNATIGGSILESLSFVNLHITKPKDAKARNWAQKITCLTEIVLAVQELGFRV